MQDSANPAWSPTPAFAANCRITAFMEWVGHKLGRRFSDYHALWDWSVSDPGAFWLHFAQWHGVRFGNPPDTGLAKEAMPGAVWFPGATLNFAMEVLRHAGTAEPGQIAIRHEAEDGTRHDLSWADLARQVGTLAASLQRIGIKTGDRVVGYLPNTPETVVAFLACASVGATWSLLRAGHGGAHGSGTFPTD